MDAVLPVALVAQQPDANNPFAAPQGQPVPPGGVQDIGEFGPYYIYDGDQLVELPAVNIVRDYDYAYKCTEQDVRGLVDDGWCTAFEASAMLSTRPLKSRSIVVVSNNGWMHGDKTHYTWCIRLDVKVEQVAGVKMGNLDTETESGDPEELLHYGRHILWPIAPERASSARERWKDDETLRNSRLVEVYIPHDEPFTYKSISGHTIMPGATASTLRLIQTVKPVATPLKTPALRSTEPPMEFELPGKPLDALDLPCEPRFTSHIVSSGLSRRAARCMRFTARNSVGWNSMSDDLQEHIWELLAAEAIRTKGRIDSASLTMWLRLRRVCHQSKHVVERLTKQFMQRATTLILASRNTFSVSDAIKVRDLLLPRGINPHALTLEINHKEAEFVVDVLWTSIHPYMRIRSGKPPTECAPAPVSQRRVKLMLCGSSNCSASISLPEPKPERSSLRIGLKRSARDFSPSLAQTSASALPEIYTVVPTAWKGITLKLNLPDEPKPVCKGKEKMVQVNWVQCDDCNKWRILPGGDALSVHDIPKHWFCDLHPSGCVTCDDPEDMLVDGEVTTASFDSGTKRFKKSDSIPVRRTRSSKVR